MGLFQKSVETYDNMNSLAGVEFTDKATLAPIGHLSTGVRIVITLTKDGEFEKAEEIYNIKTDANGKTKNLEKKITIPVTEASAGRSSGIAPHPLCDKFMYMSPQNKEKYDKYVSQLEDWCNSKFAVPQIGAVLKYIKSGNICDDVASIKDIKPDDFVCWRVRTTDNDTEELWKNKSVINSYVNYYTEKVSTHSKNLCYILGTELPVAEQHLKGVVPYAGNAKLISANDTTNYTYRGRFLDSMEASTVSYLASQKAHNALKWVVANNGVQIGDRTIVCWNPKGKTVPKLMLPLFKNHKESKEKITPSNYKDELAKVVFGYKNNFDIEDDTITAIFEAATTGRLSVSYYSEIKAYDFLERMYYWDETLAWEHPYFGVCSPSLRSICEAAYGTICISNNMQTIEVDDKVKAQTLQKLILCRLEKNYLTYDIMHNAVQKCSQLHLYDDNKHGDNEPGNRMNQLYTTCAIIRKYYCDHKKEELSMALDPDKTDRSYQFGRLLAVLEKAERDTYDSNEKRESNAMRLQPVYVKRPMYAAKIVIEQLKNAYMPKLSVGKRAYYERLIGEIMFKISDCDDSDINKPLDEKYLIGYYLQKNKLYEKKNDNKMEDEE